MTDIRIEPATQEPAVSAFYDAVLCVIEARHRLKSLHDAGLLAKVAREDREALRRAFGRLVDLHATHFASW